MLYRQIRLPWIFSLLSMAVLAIPISAQTGAGTIQGTVRDATGAVIPAATVQITHSQTARVYQTVSSSVGFFIQPGLQVGGYKIQVTAAGMQAWEGSLELQTGQVAVLSPQLSVATSSTTVTVAGDVSSMVVSESPTLGAVLEQKRIEQLPLDGRFLTTLLALTTPGVEGVGNTQGPWVYGFRSNAFDMVQDGAVMKDLETANLAKRPPGIDTVAEFRVETNNSSARSNRPATAIVVTKSGTNQLHGAAFETARNSGLGVARRRQDYYDKPPHLVRNEFGASLGGPVVLPKLYDGRNRTFFFGAYEAYRLRSASTTNVSVPTTAMRGGDFSGLVDATGRPLTLYDAWSTGATWSRLPYPGNVIPLNKRSPVATYLYNVTPLPTLPDRNPLVTSNYFGPGFSNRSDLTVTARIDHRLSDRDQVFFRYTYGTVANSYIARAAPPTLDNSVNSTNWPSQDITGVFSWTRTISPAFFSETVASYSYDYQEVTAGDYYHDWAGGLGLPNPFDQPGFPNIGNTGFGMVYNKPDPYRVNKSRLFSFNENLTKVAGKHELQFGGSFRYDYFFNIPDQQNTSGNINFGGGGTALYDPKSGSSYAAVPQTGFAGANLFLGLADSYSVQYIYSPYKFLQREYSTYLQDNYRVTQRLTLNFGLRWEIHPAFAEKNNLLTGFDPATKSIVLGRSLDDLYKMRVTTPEIVSLYTRIGVKFSTADKVGLPSGMVNPNYFDFGPRAGFAYRLSSGARPLVVRGGYAAYTFPYRIKNYSYRERTTPPFSASFTQSYSDAAQSPDGKPNWGLRSAPTVVAGINSANVIDPAKPGAVPRGGFTTYYMNPNLPSTRAQEWNLTFEKELMENTVARAGWIGTHGSHLDELMSLNGSPNNYVWWASTGLPLPTGEYAGVAQRKFDNQTYGDIVEFLGAGISNYSGVQLELQRRYARGYAFQIFYVIGNAMAVGGKRMAANDTIADPNQFLPGAVPQDPDARNRFLGYARDTEFSPKHRVRWNWLVDLPVGHGKPVLRNASPVLNRFVGGWQLAGFGSWQSRYWELPQSNWGELGNVEVYGTKYPVQDCRSGACIPGYLYYNGYIPANRINSYDPKTGKPNGIMGVPANYHPSNLPVIPMAADGGSASDPLRPYYDSNTVWIPLKNGTSQRANMDTNLHPWRNQFMPGPGLFTMDASLFKSIPIKERVVLRINADFFQVLNNPGMGLPNALGIVSLQNSANAARQMQLTIRLLW